MANQETWTYDQWRAHLQDVTTRGAQPDAKLTLDEWRDFSIEHMYNRLEAINPRLGAEPRDDDSVPF